MRVINRHVFSKAKLKSTAWWMGWLLGTLPLWAYAESPAAAAVKTSTSSPAPAANATPPLFVTPTGPPPGFEDVSDAQTTYISIFYQGKLLVNTMASFDDSTVTLQNPTEIVKKIPGLKDPQAVLQALSSKMLNHSDYLCPASNISSQSPYCKTLEPAVAGLIMDPNNYRAFLFVNPDDITAAALSINNLPPSDAGFSYLNTAGLIAGQTAGADSYSFTNTGIWAYKNDELTAALNLTQNTSQGISSSVLSVQNINASRFNNNQLYSAGMLTTVGNEFIAGQPILGFSVANYSLNGINSPFHIEGTPLIVYLPLPSQVAFYKGSQLLYTVHLPAGKQTIDTSNFPIGAYNIDIQITADGMAEPTTQTQFYVKQPQLPSAGKYFNLTVGMMQKNTFGGATTLPGEQTYYIPSYTWIPVLSYSEMRRWGKNWGTSTNVISNANRIFLGNDLNYFFANGNGLIAPGSLISNNLDYGLSFTGNYIFNNITMNTSVTRIFYNANTENLLVNNNGATGLTQVGSGFMPLSGSDLQAMANLGVNVYKTSVTVGQSVSHQPGQAVLRSKNLTVVRPLWSTASSSLMLNLTATRSSGNDSVLASFQFTFFTPTLTVTATTGENYSGAPDQPSTRHLDSSVSIDKRYTWNIQNLLDIQGGYYNMLGAQTYTGSINYQSAFVNSMFNVAQTRLSSGESRTNYGLNLYSSVSYTEGDFAFGNNQNYLSGVIVRVKAANKGDVVVYVNDQPTAIVRTNRSQTIFLQPYKTYTFTINPVGSTLYSFDHSPNK